METTTDIASRELWEKAKKIYLDTIGSQEEKSQVERYLSMIVSVERNGDTFVVCTSNAFSAEFLKANYSERMKMCLKLVAPEGNVELEFKFREAPIPSIIKPIPDQSKHQKISTFVSTMPLN